MKEIKGRAWKLGDNVDTDLIIAGPYLTIRDEDELASHALEAVLPEFAANAREGDFLFAGKNLGAGSSREEAPYVLKKLGVRVIVAKSYARIFFRNAVNLGLVALEHPTLPSEVEAGDSCSLDLKSFVLKDETRGTTHELKPLPGFLMGIVEAGGALEKLRRELDRERRGAHES
ncbi:MAG: 3-isopropylmalate dehydratase small subunit [Promethearchaeota archaeon]